MDQPSLPRTPAPRPRAAGVYKGRPASIDAAQVRAMKAQGLGASEIAKTLKIGRASVYRVLEAGSRPRPQRPHDRDQPFASMQRPSNSSCFASAAVPAE